MGLSSVLNKATEGNKVNLFRLGVYHVKDYTLVGAVLALQIFFKLHYSLSVEQLQ